MGEYFRLGNVSIYNDNFLNTVSLTENSVDLVITSPPYNVDVHYKTYDDKISYEAYLKFT